MKFGIMFANAGPFADPELFAHLVTTADSAGIESMWTVEHVIVPRNYESTYPYAEGGKMPGPENSPIPDPFVALSFAAAITRRMSQSAGRLSVLVRVIQDVSFAPGPGPVVDREDQKRPVRRRTDDADDGQPTRVVVTMTARRSPRPQHSPGRTERPFTAFLRSSPSFQCRRVGRK